jgi:transcriptional regulator with XRE-family HTH domain
LGVASGIHQRAICAQVIKLLQAERKRRGMSKYTLSAQTGLAQQTISYMERGMRQPSFETILRVADGIGVDLEEVLKQARDGIGKTSKL